VILVAIDALPDLAGIPRSTMILFHGCWAMQRITSLGSGKQFASEGLLLLSSKMGDVCGQSAYCLAVSALGHKLLRSTALCLALVIAFFCSIALLLTIAQQCLCLRPSQEQFVTTSLPKLEPLA